MTIDLIAESTIVWLQRSNMSRSSVAIVGSGPSACYTAQALLRESPETSVVVFERQILPYGLLRWGVAADHTGTRAVSRQFDRLFARGAVRFAGGVDVGVDIDLAALREAFDAVVLATGLHQDRSLELPGDTLQPQIGAGRLIRALHRHPGEAPRFATGRRTVIIGAGNVALDVARLLAKGPDRLPSSLLDVDTLRAISGGLRHIDILSRSPAAQARFEPAMLRELESVEGVQVRVFDGALSPSVAPLISTPVAADLTSTPSEPSGIDVALRFSEVPTAITGTDAVSGVQTVNSETGALTHLPADSVITAIGYRQREDDPLHLDRLLSPENGRLGRRLYHAGWLKTGPRGTIADQREPAAVLATEILNEIEGDHAFPRPGWGALPASIRSRAIGWNPAMQLTQPRTSAAKENV